MGSQPTSELMSAAEAGELLEVSSRTVFSLVRRGVLVPARRNRRDVLLRRSDVLAYREMRAGRDLGTTEVASIAVQARSIAKTTERDVQHLYDLLGLNRATLDRTPEGIRALYAELRRTPLDNERMSTDWVRYWASAFFAIDEDFLSLAEEALPTARPWEDLFSFASGLMGGRPGDAFRFIPQLMRAYQYFDTARAHVRHVSYFYARTMFGREAAEHVAPEKRSGTLLDQLASLMLDNA